MRAKVSFQKILPNFFDKTFKYIFLLKLDRYKAIVPPTFPENMSVSTKIHDFQKKRNHEKLDLDTLEAHPYDS